MAPRKSLSAVHEAIAAATDVVSVRKVFGEPVEREGTTVIPAANVIGGGGGGGGAAPGSDPESPVDSGGVGYGLIAWPAGAFELRGGEAHWRPAVDVTKIVLGLAALLLIAFRSRAGTR